MDEVMRGAVMAGLISSDGRFAPAIRFTWLAVVPPGRVYLAPTPRSRAGAQRWKQGIDQVGEMTP